MLFLTSLLTSDDQYRWDDDIEGVVTVVGTSDIDCALFEKKLREVIPPDFQCRYDFFDKEIYKRFRGCCKHHRHIPNWLDYYKNEDNTILRDTTVFLYFSSDNDHITDDIIRKARANGRIVRRINDSNGVMTARQGKNVY